MHFEQDYIYHIYNQGNSRQQIFFNRKNYLFFLEKIWKYIVPYCDVLAYCLMPNHFHLMVQVNKLSIAVSETERLGVSPRHTESGAPSVPEKLNLSSETEKPGVFPKHAEFRSPPERTLNASIGIMLMAYAKAINNQQSRTGKLFREKTKAECINCPKGITPSFYNTEFGTQIHVSNPEKEYPQACFNYIHRNPVKAGLVKQMHEWEYSSYSDYAGLRNGKLVNKKAAEQLGLFSEMKRFGSSETERLGVSPRHTESGTTSVPEKPNLSSETEKPGVFPKHAGFKTPSVPEKIGRSETERLGVSPRHTESEAPSVPEKPNLSSETEKPGVFPKHAEFKSETNSKKY